MLFEQFVNHYTHCGTYYWKSSTFNKHLMNVVDGGSNEGQEIEIFLTDSNPPHCIHSFEPHPIFYDKLLKKYKKYQNIVLHKKALWSKNTIKKFYFKRNINANNGGASLIEQKTNININEYMDVECTNICDFISNSKHQIDLLKLDVEGAEYEIFNAIIENNLLNKINSIVFEDHSRKINTHSWNHKKIQVLQKFKNHNINFNLK